jgi:hypothetical protein
VVEEEGVAVRHPYPEEEARGGGEEAIPFPNPRALHEVEGGAVHLLKRRHRGVAEGAEDPALVLRHLLRVVPGGGGEVEAMEGAFRNPAEPGGEAVGCGQGGGEEGNHGTILPWGMCPLPLSFTG